MRMKLINYIKRHNIIYSAYSNLICIIVKLLIIVFPQKKKITFTSLGGRKFDDSPRAIYEKMCVTPEFDSYDFVWLFIEPEKFSVQRGRKVKIETLRYLYEIVTSSVWVHNSGMIRGVGNIKQNKIINVDTWHGTPLKKMGKDMPGNVFNSKKMPKDTTSIRCAQSEYDCAIFQRLFNADEKCFVLCDLPRNDALLKYSNYDIETICNKLCIPKNKKVILYTPTFRDYAWDANGENFIAPPMDMEKWKRRLGDRYVLLFRAHYAVSAAMNIKNDDFVIDVTNYPVLNDLYIISDIMISDYSSTYFDYAILDRPMFCFAYDYEEYLEKRGVYLDMENDLPCRLNKTENDLIDDILGMDYDRCIEQSRKFHKRYAPNAGHASEAIVDVIKQRLNL